MIYIPIYKRETQKAKVKTNIAIEKKKQEDERKETLKKWPIITLHELIISYKGTTNELTRIINAFRQYYDNLVKFDEIIESLKTLKTRKQPNPFKQYTSDSYFKKYYKLVQNDKKIADKIKLRIKNVIDMSYRTKKNIGVLENQYYKSEQPLSIHITHDEVELCKEIVDSFWPIISLINIINDHIDKSKNVKINSYPISDYYQYINRMWD
jgi:hypothetical protein